MIRVYFVYEDPLDEGGVNLSFADVPTQDPGKAPACMEEAAESGELWKSMYPEDQECPYRLIRNKMMFLDVSGLSNEVSADTVLPM